MALNFPLHKNFWIPCPCKFYVLAFRDLGILSLLAKPSVILDQ